jgi:hypothetical protein
LNEIDCILKRIDMTLDQRREIQETILHVGFSCRLGIPSTTTIHTSGLAE